MCVYDGIVGATRSCGDELRVYRVFLVVRGRMFLEWRGRTKEGSEEHGFGVKVFEEKNFGGFGVAEAWKDESRWSGAKPRMFVDASRRRGSVRLTSGVSWSCTWGEPFSLD